MLRYTQQANEDLSRILAFDDIVDHIEEIDNLTFHRTNTFVGLDSYGEFVFTYTRNRTNWYAFYDKCGEES